MAISLEFLIKPEATVRAKTVLQALRSSADAAGFVTTTTKFYHGHRDWLVMWGIGAEGASLSRDNHIKSGGKVILWDMGYFPREKANGMLRPSINTDFPTKWLSWTSDVSDRWQAQNITLRNDFDPGGPIILVGIGPKQREYRSPLLDTWEVRKFNELKVRFPGRTIIHRPKPKRPHPVIPRCAVDEKSRIEKLLEGASLVVAHQSNVAVDAVIAGIPIECEDGVATWLDGKPYTVENRLSLLHRLSYWQYRPSEFITAWKFLLGMSSYI